MMWIRQLALAPAGSHERMNATFLGRVAGEPRTIVDSDASVPMDVEMSEANPKEISGPVTSDGGTAAVALPEGMSPYATGGGGVTFERKVAVQYLAHLLVGDGASELGDGRRVVSVGFQQAPDHPVDDLAVSAALPDELQPSLVLSLAVRRSPNLVGSDESTRKLIRQFVDEMANAPMEGPEHRMCLVVAGPQEHAEQLATLASHAAVQMDAAGFFRLIGTPRKFQAAVRTRLAQLAALVERALHDLGVANTNAALVQQRTWELLSRLAVSMPRLESPDDTDWAAVANSLIPVAQGSDPTAAAQLRDRLVALSNEYAPKSARVDLTVLRRGAHAMLDPTTRRNQKGWQVLDHLHCMALAAVRDEITGSDGGRVSLDRSGVAAELVAAAAKAAAVVVSGESGVGKSALTLLGVTAADATGSDSLQALCINLRQVSKLSVQLKATLGCPLSSLLCELSASQRMLIIDAADAVAEGMTDAFRYLVDAAHNSEVKVIAVTSVESQQVVRDMLTDRFGTEVMEHTVSPLSEAELGEIVKTFTELRNLSANRWSRELLRRLVVVDLLVRGRVRGVPLTDADAMQEMWSGLVRRHEMSDRGAPDAREFVLLKLAALALTDVSDIEPLDVSSGFDPAALAGLRRDGLLRTSHDDPFKIGPEFAHDEVRRYAVARLLLDGDTPASRILQAGAPRWSLSAAQLACQAWLQRPHTAKTPLTGRLDTLQESFDRLVRTGHGTRWGDVPGEALLSLARPRRVLRDAWPGLLADDAVGLRRLARLVDQRLRDKSGIVNHIAVAPVIELLLEDVTPWQSGKYIEDLLRDWLQAHVVAKTPAGDPLRILLRKRLVAACVAGDRRLAEEREAVAATSEAERAPQPRKEDRRLLTRLLFAFRRLFAWGVGRRAHFSGRIERARRSAGSHNDRFVEVGYGSRPRRQRPEVPREITDAIVLELLALVGPDLGSDGEAILCRVARDAPSWLAPAVEELFTGHALANYRRGLLVRLTEAYYVDEESGGSRFDDDGIRRHRARSFGIVPQSAYFRGPFTPLLQTDFRNGVAVINRLLNHAARIRVSTLAGLGPASPPFHDSVGDELELEITGTRRRYIGDGHVWRWYRGTAVGPYPCMSALQSLERVCDQLIKIDIPISTVIEILLRDCDNLAMVGLVVGLLVRHLEHTGRLLDPYLADPLIWHHEFGRSTGEMSGLAAGSEGLVNPDRRTWSLREAAGCMVLRADERRAAELRAVGETLVAKARRDIESAEDESVTEPAREAGDSAEHQLAIVRAWASSLDRSTYRAYDAPDGPYIQSMPPEDVTQALEPSDEKLERAQAVSRLVVRYHINRNKRAAGEVGPDELTTDLAMARRLLEHPPSDGILDPWEAPAMVAVAALESHLLSRLDFPNEALSFAAETVLQIGEAEATGNDEFDHSYYEQGADRSAARAVPLLLLPSASRLRSVIDRADGCTTFERAVGASMKLAQAATNEVPLHLARGLDHLWKTPCTEDGHCHHEVGWLIATETMRHCVFSGWDPATKRRTVRALKEPYAYSLDRVDDNSILAFRLDAAIRALAPAAIAGICVSARARDLLLTLLAAQRRSLLSEDHYDADHRGSHTLLSARALLTLAEECDDAPIHEHINAFADSSALLGHLISALSAAAEETPERAATARRIWPNIVRRVLEMKASGLISFRDRNFGDMAFAALIPNATVESSYLYPEVEDSRIAWWQPLAMQPEVEAWLVTAAGRSSCVDHLIKFLRVLTPEDQVRTGLPWVTKLVCADPAHTASHSYMVTSWLIEIRSTAADTDLLASWQEVVDALVVAGVRQLAPYSE